MKIALIALCLVPPVVGGAFLFRLRGDYRWFKWTGRGATSIRCLWALYLAAAVWLADDGPPRAWDRDIFLVHADMKGEPVADWVLPLPVMVVALAAALWLGAVWAWWGSLGVRNSREVAMHSLRGLLWVAPAAALLWMAGIAEPWALLAVGALCGPIYLLARLRRPFRAVEDAEWVFGGAIAATLIGSAVLT